MAQVLIKNIVRQLHEIQEGSLWFDQCFREKIGSLSEEEAFANPLPQIHRFLSSTLSSVYLLYLPKQKL